MHIHQLHVNTTDYRWPVDCQVIAQQWRWASRYPEALVADLHGMARSFPTWLMVGGRAQQPVRCPACRLPCVPTAGAFRCPACQTPLPAEELLWFGQLPSLARPEPTFAAKRIALQRAGFAEIQVQHQHYLLVPLLISYPHEWPNLPPTVSYVKLWLQTLGLPLASATHHLVGNGQACLYAYAEWQASSIAAVLQQRVANHLHSLLKIAAGIAPERAFLGRAHHYTEWMDR